MKIKILILYSLLLISACSKASSRTSSPATLPIAPFQSAETIQPTLTYLPITPVYQGTQLPEYGSVITSQNIDRLTLLSQWGKGNPRDVLYTPDGKYFVIGSSRGLYFYDTSDYSLVHYIDSLVAIVDLAVTPDSRTIAAVAQDEVLLYQLPGWQQISSIKEDANSVDFSPDGKMIALGIHSDSDYLQLRDVSTGEVIGTFKNELGVRAVKISPGGDIIATGGYSTTIWSLNGSILDQDGPYVSGGFTYCVSFSPNGNFLAEGAYYHVRIWRVLENGHITKYRDLDISEFVDKTVFNVAISPDGKKVAATLSTGIGVWDIFTGLPIMSHTNDSSYTVYTSLAWSTDSRTIASASTKSGVRLWDISTGENTITLNSPYGSFTSLAWSPDGLKLGVGAEESIAYVFDTRSGIPLNDFGFGYQLNSLAFAPDGQTLAIGYDDRAIQIWDLEGSLIREFEGWGFGSSDVTFSADGKHFAAVQPESWQSPPQVRMWNTGDWRVEKVFPIGDRDNFMITGFTLAPDENTGAISFVDMQVNHTDYINIFSIYDGSTIATLEPKGNRTRAVIHAMEYSPDNKLLAALVYEFFDPNPRLLIWQVGDWSLLYQITINAGSPIGFGMNQRDILTWSHDGSMIAVGVHDGSIQLFKKNNGDRISILLGHTMAVGGVSFSPDGRILASVSLDGTIMLWGIR